MCFSLSCGTNHQWWKRFSFAHPSQSGLDVAKLNLSKTDVPEEYHKYHCNLRQAQLPWKELACLAGLVEMWKRFCRFPWTGTNQGTNCVWWFVFEMHPAMEKTYTQIKGWTVVPLGYTDKFALIWAVTALDSTIFLWKRWCCNSNVKIWCEWMV